MALNFQRGSARDEPELNLVPLIDVLMVILIFLMVTTTYSRYTELQITLPEATGEAPANKPAEVTVSVDAEGRYAVNEQAITFTGVADITNAMKQAAGGAESPVIIINADARATHQAVVSIMEAAREAGYTQITFTTQSQAR